MELQHLPTMPADAKGIQVGTDRVLVMIRPQLPNKPLPKGIKLTGKIIENYMADMQAQLHEERLQKSSMRTAVIISVPINHDATVFPYKVNDVVMIPNETDRYDVINRSRTPLYLVGTRDIRLVLPELTAEEAKEWDTEMEIYRDTILYPENPLDSPDGRDMPAPRRSINKDGKIE